MNKKLEEVNQAYKLWPLWYDIRGLLILTFAYNRTLWSQLNFFSKNFSSQHLEVACGDGKFLQIVLWWRRHILRVKARSEITGVDVAEAMLAGAKQRFAMKQGMSFVLGDAANLPKEWSERFGSVNIVNSVHCIPDARGALSNAYRVLGPGGKLAINVLLYPRTIWPFGSIANRINSWAIRTHNLQTPWNSHEVLECLKAIGFEIKEQKVTCNCIDVVAVRPTTRT
jgi:ubiquinone/menaquinone biosynthesis C-methylase UbiE